MSKELEDKQYYLDVVDNLKFAEMYFEANEMKRLVEYLFTPPTAEEVCKALSEYYGEEVIFKHNSFHIRYEGHTEILVINHLTDKPHLITLIGRFYEGLGK